MLIPECPKSKTGIHIIDYDKKKDESKCRHCGLKTYDKGEIHKKDKKK